MEATTATRTERPAGLDASTVAEAFQLTARAHPDGCALRLKDDELSITWAEYADKVRRTAAGLAGMGLGRGDAMGIMLTNRPEFHFFDSAALHLGATPFSIYNTYAPEQIEYLASDAQNRILVTEQAFLDTILKVRELVDSVEHVVVVDGGGDDTLSIEDVEGRGEDGFDFEATWRAVEPDDI